MPAWWPFGGGAAPAPNPEPTAPKVTLADHAAVKHGLDGAVVDVLLTEGNAEDLTPFYVKFVLGLLRWAGGGRAAAGGRGGGRIGADRMGGLAPPRPPTRRPPPTPPAVVPLPCWLSSTPASRRPPLPCWRRAWGHTPR